MSPERLSIAFWIGENRMVSTVQSVSIVTNTNETWEREGEKSVGKKWQKRYIFVHLKKKASGGCGETLLRQLKVGVTSRAAGCSTTSRQATSRSKEWPLRGYYSAHRTVIIMIAVYKSALGPIRKHEEAIQICSQSYFYVFLHIFVTFFERKTKCGTNVDFRWLQSFLTLRFNVKDM